jgi:uncharacterized membrane protein YciS (DUF1049 family)
MKLLKKLFSVFLMFLIPLALTALLSVGVLRFYSQAKEWFTPMADSWLTVEVTFRFYEIAFVCMIIGLLLAILINCLIDVRWFFLERRLNKRIKALETECAQLKQEAAGSSAQEEPPVDSGDASSN